MADLYERLLAAITQHGGPLGVGTALRAVVDLCESRMAEAVGGGLTDVDTISPTEILQAIARELEVDGGQ